MKKLLFCTHRLNKANIRREPRKGVEHIVLTSFTLPPNIVMNGGLYSEEEIDKSFLSLNRTPCTVEHPEIDGVFVSANDPEIDLDFRFGMFNENARKIDDGRIALDKVINVQKALMTDKGKRLLDRISEVETNENARPIHTSVGVFLDVEEVELATNDREQEYTWLAKDMIFDHDAILLDSIGASTPDQGTGIGVNKEQLKVEHYVCSTSKQRKVSHFVVDELSFSEISERISQALMARFEGDDDKPDIWIRQDSITSDSFVYQQDDKLFKSKYEIDENENVRIQDSRQEVRFKSEYEPVETTVKPTEENTMRDKLIEMLGKFGIAVNTDISDADLEAELQKALKAKNEPSEPTVNKELAETVKGQATKIGDLEAKLKANAEKENEKKFASIAACDKYKGLSVNAVKAIADNSPEDFEEMYTNSIPSYGIGPTNLVPKSDDVDDGMFQVNVAETK